MRRPIPFGRFLMLDRIAIGGMAEVFAAKTFGMAGVERLVAIKRILPNLVEDEEFITMFIDEARIAAQLSHANIVQIHELGKHETTWYIAMEYVSGRDVRSISEKLAQNKQAFPIGMGVLIAAEIAAGLDYAHAKTDGYGNALGIIHRDISPHNVLVSYDGEVKIIDFGIAKAAGRIQKTQAGILKGKFSYMSPEQVRGLDIDHRSDIFSAGVMLYEMLTGSRLFRAESDLATLERVREAKVPPPRERNPEIPEELERIMLKALAGDRQQRYQTAGEFHDDLLRFLFSGFSGDQIYSSRRLGEFMRTAFSQEFRQETTRLRRWWETTQDDASSEGSLEELSRQKVRIGSGEEVDADQKTTVLRTDGSQVIPSSEVAAAGSWELTKSSSSSEAQSAQTGQPDEAQTVVQSPVPLSEERTVASTPSAGKSAGNGKKGLEASLSESSGTDAPEPESFGSKESASEASRAKLLESDRSEPGTELSTSGTADSGGRQEAKSESGGSDPGHSGAQGSGTSDSQSRESGYWDSESQGFGSLESGSHESGSPDSSSRNSEFPDSESQDSALSSPRTKDSRSTDSRSTDSGSTDSGSKDSGSKNSGSKNSGSKNSGSKNSGSKESECKDSGSDNSEPQDSEDKTTVFSFEDSFAALNKEGSEKGKKATDSGLGDSSSERRDEDTDPGSSSPEGLWQDDSAVLIREDEKPGSEPRIIVRRSSTRSGSRPHPSRKGAKAPRSRRPLTPLLLSSGLLILLILAVLYPLNPLRQVSENSDGLNTSSYLSVGVHPPEARLRLNGLTIPLPFEEEVEAGKHLLQLDAPGFIPFEQVIELRRGQVRRLEVQLTPDSEALDDETSKGGAETAPSPATASTSSLQPAPRDNLNRDGRTGADSSKNEARIGAEVNAEEPLLEGEESTSLASDEDPEKSEEETAKLFEVLNALELTPEELEALGGDEDLIRSPRIIEIDEHGEAQATQITLDPLKPEEPEEPGQTTGEGEMALGTGMAPEDSASGGAKEIASDSADVAVFEVDTEAENPEEKEALTAESARVVARCHPAAKVFINGKDTQRWTPIHENEPILLPPGKHEIACVSPDGRQAHQEIELDAGEIFQFRATLD